MRMRRALALINQNCRLAARLISDALDRPLTPLERVGLGIHVTGCRSCRRYRKQLAVIDQLVAAETGAGETNQSLSEEARERIAGRLHR